MPRPEFRQSTLGMAYEWASRITSVALMMALPALGGWWLDSRWGTSPWLLILAGLLGLVAGFVQLLQMVKVLSLSDRSRRSDDR